MKLIRNLAIAVLGICVSGFADEKKTAGFDEVRLRGVISIELLNPGQTQCVGSAFLMDTPSNLVALVTAKHVIVDKATGKVRPNIGYRLPTFDSNRIFSDNEQSFFAGPWLLSTNLDVACRLLAFPQGDTNFNLSVTPHWWYFSNDQLTAGATVYALGYPLNLRSDRQPRPIIRRGIIARADADGLIIDAQIFPGNSGGPVFYSPDVNIRSVGPGVSIHVPYSQDQKLVGLVSETIAYQDTAFSKQTGRAKIQFEEMTGLTFLVPAQAIADLLNSEEFRIIQQRARSGVPFFPNQP